MEKGRELKSCEAQYEKEWCSDINVCGALGTDNESEEEWKQWDGAYTK